MASDDAPTPQVSARDKGISMRYTKQFDCRTDNPPARFDLFVNERVAAEWLASRDARNVPHEQKIADALTLIRESDGTLEI